MTLVEHARRELELCGQYEEDPEFSESIIRAVEAFASYGHSGGSAVVGTQMLYELLQFKNLSPLTTADDEWIDRTQESGYPMWQNVRNSAVFSDGPPWALTSEVYEINASGSSSPVVLKQVL